MILSIKAISDLRKTLIEKYESDFNLSDESLNEIGLFLVTSLAEVLKHKVKMDC